VFTGTINGGQFTITATDDGVARPGLADEAARLNANTATAEMLAGLDAMDPTAAAALVAARAALAARIAAATAPAAPPVGLTGPIATLDQLERLLREATDGDDVATEALLERLTIHTRALNLDADGRRRVNLNTAAPAELMGRLAAWLAPEQVDAIVRARDSQPFTSVGELLTRPLTVPGPEGQPVAVTIPPEVVAACVDHLAVTDAPVLPGRVNVNTASAEVLACLPGLDATTAAALVDYRRTADRAALQSIGWLLAVLDDETFRLAAPHVTTRTAQFRAEVAWTDDNGGRPAGATAVIERAGGRVGLLCLERPE